MPVTELFIYYLQVFMKACDEEADDLKLQGKLYVSAQ